MRARRWADRLAGVPFARTRPGPSPPGRARDAQPVHERDRRRGVVTLPGAGHPGQRPAAGRRAGEPWWSARPGPAQRLPVLAGLAGSVPAGGVLVIRCSPPCAPGRSAAATASRSGSMSPAAHAAPRPRAGAPGPPSHPPPPSTPCPPPHHTRPAARPGSSPTSRPLTSGDAGYTRSSSSRTAPAGPATGTPPGSVEPVDHQPVIIPPVPLPRMTRQQRHQPHPLRIVRSCRFSRSSSMPIQPKRPSRSTGHALAATRRYKREAPATAGQTARSPPSCHWPPATPRLPGARTSGVQGCRPPGPGSRDVGGANSTRLPGQLPPFERPGRQLPPLAAHGYPSSRALPRFVTGGPSRVDECKANIKLACLHSSQQEMCSLRIEG